MIKNDKILVKIENVTKSFSNKILFENVSFSIYEKEILGILGYSGEGKSSLLNIISGIESFDSGEIQYYYKDKFYDINSYKNSFVKELIGYSTQEPSIYDELSLIENIEFYASLLEVDKKEVKKRIKKLLEIFNLEKYTEKKGGELSVGQKKRLDLACSLIHNPSILILDEPTANLDFKLRDDILKYIKKINKLGVTIIYVSHFIEEIEELSNRVLMINDKSCKIISNVDLKKKFLNFAKKNE